ncbi:DUF883 domain-containing protein, partial [Burkholderia contaminans]
MSEINKEKLMSDIKTVLSDAEDLLKQAASSPGAGPSELHDKAMSRPRQTTGNTARASDAAVQKD